MKMRTRVRKRVGRVDNCMYNLFFQIIGRFYIERERERENRNDVHNKNMSIKFKFIYISYKNTTQQVSLISLSFRSQIIDILLLYL